jgi:3'-phosphoadenosine 5'-phosphosulfate sulfotransferase (PAPS reductase)/FAD synthetase
MKKNPAHKYGKDTGRKPMTAQMASESRQRTQKWLQNGCNGFDMKSPISNPMAFWTEQDVLEYISLYLEKPLKDAWSNIYNHNKRKRKKARKYLKKNNYRKTAICSVYGEVVEDRAGTDEVAGQMTISDIQGFENMELFDAKRLPLKTTGCNRTGCMFCGFGCHLESESRFERMKVTHPKIYEYVFKPWSEGGLGYKEVIDWINEHGNMNIRY